MIGIVLREIHKYNKTILNQIGANNKPVYTRHV